MVMCTLRGAEETGMAGRTRREFLVGTAATMAATATMLNGRALWASALGLPIGLQLYSVRELLPTN